MNTHYNILDAPFVKEICEVTRTLWKYGWAERNGGNISYRLEKDEVSRYLDINHH